MDCLALIFEVLHMNMDMLHRMAEGWEPTLKDYRFVPYIPYIHYIHYIPHIHYIPYIQCIPYTIQHLHLARGRGREGEGTLFTVNSPCRTSQACYYQPRPGLH